MDYMKRVADEQLSMKMEAFGAALILGPKGCGKTTTGKHFSKSFVEFQDEDQRENLLLIANTKPSDLLKGEKPILFDEWQDAPKIWGAIRKDVDDMFAAMQASLNDAREEFERKFNEKAKSEKKLFSFATDVTGDVGTVIGGEVPVTETVTGGIVGEIPVAQTVTGGVGTTIGEEALGGVVGTGVEELDIGIDIIDSGEEV